MPMLEILLMCLVANRFLRGRVRACSIVPRASPIRSWRGPQLQQLITLFHRHSARLVRFRAGNFFFEIFKLRIERSGVEFRQGDRLLGEDGKARRSNLGETTAHEKTQFFCGRFVDHDNAWLHRRDQGCMIFEDGEFAFRSRNDHGFDISRKDECFGRNEFKVKSRHRTPREVVSVVCSCCEGSPVVSHSGKSYAASAASFCAFSTASSMEPTI